MTALGTGTVWGFHSGPEAGQGRSGGREVPVHLLHEWHRHARYGGSNFISIDQFVADGLLANGIRTQIPSLILGGVPAQEQRVFYRGGKKLAPIASPATAFQAIFSGATPAAGMGGAPVVDPRAGRRASILSLLKGEISQLHANLGSIEREKLDIHLASIEQLEARITAINGGGGGGVPPIVAASCAAPTLPADGGQDLLNSVLHMDLAINAFACDITRVAAVQFGHHQQCAVDLPNVKGDYHNDFMHGDRPPIPPGDPRALAVPAIRGRCPEAEVHAGARRQRHAVRPDLHHVGARHGRRPESQRG